MPSVERLSITLPAEMARMIREEVQEGRYASNSEVIRDAMRIWQEREEQRAQRLAGIRARLDEADAGPSHSAAEVRAHFAARLGDPASTPSGRDPKDHG